MTIDNIPASLENVQIGINPVALADLITSTTLTGEQERRVKEHGIEHLPVLVTQSKGLIPLTFKKAKGCGRFSTTGLYSIQSLPSQWRPALTATEDGKALIYADWKCSHWQIMAYQSGDAKMIEDVESGDLYDLLRPAGMDDLTRKQFKIAGNAHLNGSGMRTTKAILGSTAAAKKFKAHIANLLATRWPTAHAWADTIREEVWKRGASPKGANFALGIGLMAIEAHHLLTVLGHADFKKYCDLLLPMHDGLLVQCDDHDVDAAKAMLITLMTETFTKGTVSDDPDGHHVDVEVHGTSWGRQTLEDGSKADVDVLTGDAVENYAYSALKDLDDETGLMVAATLIPNHLREEKMNHAPQSKAGRGIRKAMRRAVSAKSWAERKNEETSALPVLDRAVRQDGSRGPVESTSTNLQRVFSNDPRFDFWLNEWSHRNHNGEEEVNEDLILHEIKVYLKAAYGWNCKCSNQDIAGAINFVAAQRPRHPVRDRIDALQWDGKTRMDWLQDALYRNLEEDLSEYGLTQADAEMAAIHGRNFVIGMMARLYDPGCKMDEILVLSGVQGCGKQKIWHALLGDTDLYDGTSMAGMDSKDKAANLAKVWIYEDQEMSTGSAAKEEAKKAFLSNSVDTVRLPYTKTTVRMKRHVALVGSTNTGMTLLKDYTGSRRYNVVTVPQFSYYDPASPKQPLIDVAWVAENADQILAEARVRYKGDPDIRWWIDKAKDADLFQLREKQNRGKYTQDAPLDEPALRVYAANAGGNRNGFTTLEFVQCSDPEIALTDLSKGSLRYAATRALTQARFVYKKTKTRRLWVKELPNGKKPHTSDIRNGLSAFDGPSVDAGGFRSSDFRDHKSYYKGHDFS